MGFHGTLMSNIDVCLYTTNRGVNLPSNVTKRYGKIWASLIDLGLDSKKEEEQGFENDNYWKFFRSSNLFVSWKSHTHVSRKFGGASYKNAPGGTFVRVWKSWKADRFCQDLEWLTSKKGDDEYLFCSTFFSLSKDPPKAWTTIFSLSFSHNPERFRW